MQILKTGVPYFALVFAGIGMDTVRVLLLAPAVGTRLLARGSCWRQPLMLVVTVLVARWNQMSDTGKPC